MKATIIKWLVPIVLVVIGYIDKANWHESSYTRAGYVAAITLLLNFAIENHKHLIFYWRTKILNCNTDIRLSIAYLYRIKVENEYLLVKSRTKNTFQPVGGCYKTLPGAEKVFEELEVKPDRKFETEKGIAKNDLRVHVKGKNVIPFLRWFNSKQDREISPWREFCEELVSDGILPYRQFRFIDYKFKKQIQSPIITLDTGEKGIFLFEIFDLVINDEQLPELKKLKDTASDKYIWVTDYMIQKLGHDSEQKTYKYEIAKHARYAQNLKWE